MTTSEAISLSETQPNQSYWFWLSEYGVDGTPTLLFFPSKTDQKGDIFSAQVTQLRWKAPKRRYELRGSAQITAKGNLVLTSEEVIAPAKPILEYLAFVHPEQAKTLENTILIKTGVNGFEQITLGSAPQQTSALADHINTLATLNQKGDKAYFWFGHNKGKDISLILHQDRKHVKKESASLEKKRSISGKVTVDSKGRLEFRSQKEMKDFLKYLVKWVEQHIVSAPELAKMKDAHLSIRNDEGDVIERYKDSKLWNTINTKR